MKRNHPYSYSDYAKRLPKKDLQQFLLVYNRVTHCLAECGAITLSAAIRPFSGDGWELISCIDRMIELGEIVEVTPSNASANSRVFIRKTQ